MECNKYAKADTVRLYIADQGEEPLFTDAQLISLLGEYGGSTKRAAARALRIVAASEVLLSKKISTQDLSTDGPAVAAELRAQAEQLDAEAANDTAMAEGAFAAYIPNRDGGYGRIEGEEYAVSW